jgi:beta-aspartyl-peptidase (threonine type)
MRKGILLLLVLTIVAAPLAAQKSAKSSSAETDISSVLQQQVAAWNRHDLEGFMAGYCKSPDLTFFSGATVTRGWEPTLERYRQRYQANGAAMGTLDFSELVIEQLGPDSAFVSGHWKLSMPDGKQPHGLFTLVLRKFPEGWRIVHDHSSGVD